MLAHRSNSDVLCYDPDDDQIASICKPRDRLKEIRIENVISKSPIRQSLVWFFSKAKMWLDKNRSSEPVSIAVSSVREKSFPIKNKTLDLLLRHAPTTEILTCKFMLDLTDNFHVAISLSDDNVLRIHHSHDINFFLMDLILISLQEEFGIAAIHIHANGTAYVTDRKACYWPSSRPPSFPLPYTALSGSGL